MMQVATLSFGDIQVEEQDIIQFEQGLPGFEDLRKFVILHPEPSLPFSYLQSVEEGDLSFLVVSPFIPYPDYEFELSDTVKQELHVSDPDHVVVCSIVTLGKTLEDATINLLAPIVINAQARMGRQVILHNTPYRTKHPLVLSEWVGQTDAKE